MELIFLLGLSAVFLVAASSLYCTMLKMKFQLGKVTFVAFLTFMLFALASACLAQVSNIIFDYLGN